jgi:hypothetical protein
MVCIYGVGGKSWASELVRGAGLGVVGDGAKSGGEMTARRKTRWKNPVATLPRYERLFKGVQGLAEPVRTIELQRFAQLAGDSNSNGIAGALFMLEVLGYVHVVRGSRKQYWWHPGKRSDERPKNLPDLLPYKRIVELLKYFGSTPIGTKPILFDVHLADPGHEIHGRHERALGALKILAVLGLAAYDEDASGWYWTSAATGRAYKRWTFGRPQSQATRVEYDEAKLDAEAARADLASSGDF